MPVTPDEFRRTLSHLAAAVTIVAVRDGARWHGMTASAVTSLSLEPPMVLVCVAFKAAIHDRLVSSELFGISILAEDQADLAVRFADRDRHAFGEAPALSPAGLPLIGGALAHLDLRRAAVLRGGDHSIITGTVEWSSVADGRPLLHFRSRYTGLRS